MKLESKKKPVVLTYQLEKEHINLLQSTLHALNFPCVLASVKEIKSICHVRPFMVFLNFASLDEMQEKDFFAELQTLEQKSSLRQTDRRMTLTYILNCKTISDKREHIFVNKNIFADKEKLRLTLLQEIKVTEGRKAAEPFSDRLKRILCNYHDLLCFGYITKDNSKSNRCFHQDMAIVRKLLPDVMYDRKQGKYVTQYIAPHYPDEEETRAAVLAAKFPTRSKRVLLICHHLLYNGWITKEIADAFDKPVSLRMFQRDLAVIDKFVTDIVYDMDQRKYVRSVCLGEKSSKRIKQRNDDRWCW